MNPYSQEQRSYEGAPQTFIRSRRKGGLETPLEGRFSGENRRLTFAPPLWYDTLVIGCLAFGLAGPIMVFALGMSLWNPVVLPAAIAVFLAGMWGMFSSERMLCQMGPRMYVRWEGQGLGKRLTRGSLDELDAMVLQTESHIMSIVGKTVVYRLVLYWKNGKEPPLILERRTHSIPQGAPLNAQAGALFQRGAHYAQALKIPFYDNSYFETPAPLPVV